MTHPYWITFKQEQKRDYREELPTFFGVLQRQADKLKGRRVLEVVR